MGTLELYGYAIATVFVRSRAMAVSVAIRDASIIDAFWGPLFVVITWVLFAANIDTVRSKQLVTLFLVTAWGLRLAFHLTARNFGTAKTPATSLWRSHGGRNWWLKSFIASICFRARSRWSLRRQLSPRSVDPNAPFLINWIGVPIWARASSSKRSPTCS